MGSRQVLRDLSPRLRPLNLRFRCLCPTFGSTGILKTPCRCLNSLGAHVPASEHSAASLQEPGAHLLPTPQSHSQTEGRQALGCHRLVGMLRGPLPNIPAACTEASVSKRGAGLTTQPVPQQLPLVRFGSSLPSLLAFVDCMVRCQLSCALCREPGCLTQALWIAGVVL